MLGWPRRHTNLGTSADSSQGRDRPISMQFPAFIDGEAKEASLLQAAFDGVGEALLVTDNQELLVYANARAEQLFGACAGALRGKRPGELIPAWCPTEAERGAECEFQLHGDMPVWLRVRSTRWRRESGEALGWIHTLTEITELKELELQLQQSQKMEMLGRFAGGIAHDLTNFLMVVQNSAQLIADEHATSGTSSEYLPQLLRASQRSVELVAQLVAFSRKQTVQARRVVELNLLISHTEAMLHRLLPEHIQIRTAYAEDLGSVRVDPGQLEQVILNLILNARDAISGDGVIELRTRNRDWTPADRERYPFVPVGAYVSIVVHDSGCGMNEETLASIFKPFFTTKPAGQGTGLGLSTVFRIVKQNDGYILAKSRPGEGSCFEVLLPRLDDVAEQVETPMLPPGVLRGRGSVLVVEDHEGLRRLVKGLLRRAGYNVLEAQNGQEALALYRSHASRIDVLLTDVVMPAMGGTALASLLRDLQPDLRVIYTSGHTGDTLSALGSLDDADAFLPKPFGPGQLMQVLEQVMATPRIVRA